jgi:hypothetical protein
MNQTPTKVIYAVVFTIALLAMIGLLALTGTLFYKVYADPAVLTAIISIEGTLIGSLVTLLVSPRTPSPGQTTTATTTTTIPPTGPIPPTNGNGGGDTPPEVKIVNPPSEPVPTTLQPKTTT